MGGTGSFPEVPEGSMGAARLRGAAGVPTAAPLEKSKSQRPTVALSAPGLLPPSLFPKVELLFELLRP